MPCSLTYRKWVLNHVEPLLYGPCPRMPAKCFQKPKSGNAIWNGTNRSGFVASLGEECYRIGCLEVLGSLHMGVSEN